MKFPDSPASSGLYQSELRDLTAQCCMVIRRKPASFPDEQSQMQDTFHCLKTLTLQQILPHVRENSTVGLEHLPALIQSMEAGCGDSD
jgi:hypothetical protein